MSFYAPHSSQIIEEVFQRAIDYGESYELELEFINKQGDPLWVRTLGKPEQQNGKTIRITGNIMDITDRKQAEQSLYHQQQETQEAHQRLLTILDNLSLGIHVIDMDSYEIIYMSKHSRNLHRDVVGELCWQVFQEGQTGPCDFCTNERLLDATGKPKGLIQYDFYNKKEGKWYEYRDIAIEWIDGRIVRLEMALDITERQQMKESLQEKTSIIDSLLQSSPNLISVMDNEGKYIMVSDTTAKIIGRAKDEIIGKNLDELLPQQVAQVFHQNIKKLQEIRQSFTVVDRIQVDNQERVFETSLFPILLKDDKVELIGGIATDITEQLLDKERIEEYMTEIELRNLELQSVYDYLDGEVERAMVSANGTLVNYRDILLS